MKWMSVLIAVLAVACSGSKGGDSAPKNDFPPTPHNASECPTGTFEREDRKWNGFEHLYLKKTSDGVTWSSPYDFDPILVNGKPLRDRDDGALGGCQAGGLTMHVIGDGKKVHLSYTPTPDGGLDLVVTYNGINLRTKYKKVGE
jgi:hypothetical protein